MILNNNSLQEISGGAWKLGIAAGVAGFITFLVGIIDGYFRPLKCR